MDRARSDFGGKETGPVVGPARIREKVEAVQEMIGNERSQRRRLRISHRLLLVAGCALLGCEHFAWVTLVREPKRQKRQRRVCSSRHERAGTMSAMAYRKAKSNRSSLLVQNPSERSRAHRSCPSAPRCLFRIVKKVRVDARQVVSTRNWAGG
jgi:hypothetical protein